MIITIDNFVGNGKPFIISFFQYFDERFGIVFHLVIFVATDCNVNVGMKRLCTFEVLLFVIFDETGTGISLERRTSDVIVFKGIFCDIITVKQCKKGKITAIRMTGKGRIFV